MPSCTYEWKSEKSAYICTVCGDERTRLVRRTCTPKKRAREQQQNTRTAPADVPCIFRSDKSIGEVECELCGGKTTKLPIYQCAKFKECTLSRAKVIGRDAPMVCLTCKARVEPEVVTAGITTYQRPESLQRLLRSIGDSVPVLTDETRGNLSAGRNRLVQQCETKYFVLLEDDFEFVEQTDIDAMIDVLESDHAVAGVGGTLLNPGGESTWAGLFDVFRGTATCNTTNLQPKRTKEGTQYVYCDLMWNFGVFRTDVLKEFPWDEELPVGEHIEWFYRIWKSQQWRMAVARDVKIRHHEDRPSDTYRRMRKRNFRAVARKKMGVQYKPSHPNYKWPEPEKKHRRGVTVYSDVVSPDELIDQLGEVGIKAAVAKKGSRSTVAFVVGPRPDWIAADVVIAVEAATIAQIARRWTWTS